MMPAGTYYVGDLCYVLGDSWDQVCAATIRHDECLDGEFVLPDGRRFAMYGTRWGDGEYRDAQGRRYGVDAGSIGCILLSEVDEPDSAYLGQVIDFASDFDTSESDGIIRFGNVGIDTDPAYSEYEDDFEYEDES